MKVDRPIVRSFRAPFLAEAARWVRSGGHAAVWLTPRKARFVFPRPARGDLHDLGIWSALDMGQWPYFVAREGTLFEGLAYVKVPHNCFGIVRDRVIRDSIHPGPKRTIELDCLACGSCCRDNDVVLERKDVRRFEKAGRGELARPPYARERSGRIVLVLAPNKDCQHLASDNTCGIYALRPGACSEFPVGSECCLSSREEEMNLVDGAVA